MIDERVDSILKNVLDLDFNFEIKPEHDILNDLGGDSLNIVEIIMQVETEYDIEIDDNDVEELQTVRELLLIIDDYI